MATRSRPTRGSSGRSSSAGRRTRARAPRLEPELRRQQLIELGLEMFGTRPLDEVRVEDIAEAAGISRGLLFHYFPTKHDFHVAVAQAASARLLALVTPPALGGGDDHDLVERLRHGLDAFIGHIEANRIGYFTLVRGTGGADERLAAVFEETRVAIVDVVFANLGLSKPPPLLVVAVRGWVAFVEEATAAWLDRGAPSRQEVVDLCEEALVHLLETAS